MATTYLCHHGVAGMKWGIRRYQNEDGSYKSGAQGRYDTGEVDTSKGGSSSKKEAAIQKKADNAFSAKAAAYKYSAAVNGAQAKMHETLFGKEGKIMSDMNKSAQQYALKKAEEAQKAKSAQVKAKLENKEKVKSTYKDIQKNSSTGEKLLYNNATCKLAAKYVVNNNMSVDEAKKKAKKKAIRNTAIALGAYGAMTVAAYKSMK